MAVNKATVDKIKKEVEKITTLMSVDLKSVISADLEGVQINLTGGDSALMIGHHGENLSAFAYILGMILRKNIDRELVCRVDIGGYLKEKDIKITDMVQKAIEKVRRSSFPEEITGFNAYERRLAHTIVAKEGLTSESKGYGEDRTLIIKPKSFDEED